MVPKHTGGLHSILNLMHFNCFMHIPSFKMATSQNVWQLIQQGDYAFSIDLQNSYYMFPLLSIVIIFYIVWHNVPYQWHILPFGLSHILHQTHLFLCCCKSLHIVIYLDDILALICSKWAGRRACLFCVLYWSVLVYTSFFPSQTFAFLCPLLFWGFCWLTSAASSFIVLDSVCSVCRVMFFLGKAPFYIAGHSHLPHLCCVLQSGILGVYHSPTQLFSCVLFFFHFPSTRTVGYIAPKSSPLQFPLPDVVIATDATPTHWAFYFQGSGLPLSVSGAWSGSLSRAHIALQELHAVAVMLI